MPSKKNKGGKKKGGGGGNNNNKAPNNNNKQANDDDDDWEAALQEAQLTTDATSPTKEVEEATTKEAAADEPPAKEDAAEDAAAAFLASQGMEGSEATGAAAKKKKKKKKKAAGDKKPEEKVSARGKLVAEALRKQQEEKEALEKARAAEAARVAAVEAAERAEEERIAAEKERKKQKQREKIERQKKEGTYMTKAQKQKARQAQERLEAMRAAGMVPGNNNSRPTKRDDRRGGKGKGKKQEEPQKEEDKSDEEEEEEEEKEEKVTETVTEEPKVEPPAPPTPPPAEEEESSGDEWDADSDDDEMDDVLAAKLAEVTARPKEDDDEDLIAAEKRKEQEKLRLLGLERERREREEAARRKELALAEENAAASERTRTLAREEGRRRRQELEKANLAARTRSNLRCPVAVIMGHVDTGKTKLLDKIRRTNVQEGEAGGITQQIGATYFERTTLEQRTARLASTVEPDFKVGVPGMLVIDTPGHESFTNLRSRGSSLCDVAILVIDLMHGLEQQTIESLNMLRSKKTPFVVALNKVDRCYDWRTRPDVPIREALEDQPEGTLQEFRTRATDTKVQLQEQGVNSNIYWEMGDEDWENSDFVPLVPTSAVSGEGVSDVLMLLCQMAQRKLWRRLMWCANLQATVLEVKAVDGLGMTVDVLVVNGTLREGDRAVFCTLDGPVVTEIRGLLTPPPSREMRIKSDYVHHRSVRGAIGVKVIGNGLDKVMAGTPVMVANDPDEEEDVRAEVMSDLTSLRSKLSVDKKGVMVQASTLGALEALLQFLREETQPPIPVSAVGIGDVYKRDVTKISIMNEKGCPEFATILAFDVNVDREAREHANENGVRIFTAEIIYHLFDQFTRFMEDLQEKRRRDAAEVAVFPSIVKILPQHVFNQKDPIIVGVEVVEGVLKVGTPLCAPSCGFLHVGKVTSIEANGKEQDVARKGASVAVKIVNETNPTITYGRQFDSTNSLYSTLTRESIDALKSNFKDKLENEDWRLVVKMKKVFGIL